MSPFKIAYKYVFILWVLSLFYLGYVVSGFYNYEMKETESLFWQFSPLYAPVLITLGLFIELLARRNKNKIEK